MSTNFQGKVIALTGAASGIGLATAKMLASRGAILSLSDMNESLLEATAKDISSAGGKVTPTVLDVRNRGAVEDWISSTVQREGRLDGAVNLAGVIGKQIGLANIEDIEDDDWDFVVGVNLGGVLNCMRAEIKAMGTPKEERKGASIVNAASIAGISMYFRDWAIHSPFCPRSKVSRAYFALKSCRWENRDAAKRFRDLFCFFSDFIRHLLTPRLFEVGMPKNGAYIASKHAVVGLTRAAAKECGARGIRVNAIAP
jgi:NAD(P)-dependent dehydrogenase (short-subunit alcohol dehydrogenase family)